MSQTPQSEVPQGMHRITKPELVWPGKYDEHGNLREVPRVSMPFQVIETINESRVTREARKGQTLSLFEVYDGIDGNTFDDGWRNKLIWGDNLLVMGSLLERFAGQIDLIYIDPPFATGADFTCVTDVGENELGVSKERSAIEEKAYRDTWGRGVDSYLTMMYDRFRLIHELLCEDGCLFVHCDWRANSMLRVILNEVFGVDCFRNEIVWRRAPNLGRQAAASQLGRVIDTIYVYTKKPGSLFLGETPYRSQAVEVDNQGRPRGAKWDDDRQVYFTAAPRGDYTDKSIAQLRQHGRVYDSNTGQVYIKYFLRKGSDGKWYKDKPVDTLWDDNDVKPLRHCSQDELGIGYATQKPEGLLSRIIRWASAPGSLVADVFCGSGTTLAVAEKLGRRWVGCDLSGLAIHVTRKRLLGIEGCKPFEVLNLGKYERKYWQGVTFGDRQGRDEQLAVYQYLAFILKLYEAKPLTGMQHIHGKKGRALVHIGAVDAPVTIAEVNDCIEECLAVGMEEVHVLGWEWEMGLANTMVNEAKRLGVKLLLLNIPREVMEQQAVDKGDVRFFEVAHLGVDITTCDGREARVNLTDFSFTCADLIPDGVRDKIKKWSDYIDYWAVDWNFQNDTFTNGWVTYRTRKDRTLRLESDTYTYETPGTYRVMVKVIDIFGNDTSQVFDVEVK